MKNKLFITFEGIEGCGKSTQAKMLKKWFDEQNIESLLTREPGGPEISEKIRNLLLDPANDKMLPETELLLYMASRSQHTGQWLLPALNSGKVVVCDRYYDSTIAYQGAARDIDYDIIYKITKYATFGLVPDVTFLIDLPVETGLFRILNRSADRMELESFAFHQKVKQGFLDVAKKEQNRYVIIDGEKSIEEIHEIIINHIKTLLEKRG